MSYTLKNIYKKPADNPDLEINFWGSDILNLIDTFLDAGRLSLELRKKGLIVTIYLKRVILIYFFQ